MSISRMSLEEAILSCWSLVDELEFVVEAVLEKGLPPAECKVVLSGLEALGRMKFDRLDLLGSGKSDQFKGRVLCCKSILGDLSLLSRSAGTLSVDGMANAIIGSRELHSLKFNELWDEFEQSLREGSESPLNPVG